MMGSELTVEGKIAVLSDIHGNSWALEAVLADIACRGVVRVVNLGDSLYGPLDPAGTADMLIGLGLPTVSGNEDRIVIDGTSDADSPTLRFVRDTLRPEHSSWLERLEHTAVAFGSFFLCHGTPGKDSDYLLQKVLQGGVVSTAMPELVDRLAGVGQPVVFCGHDHVPRTVRLTSGKLIVNPGSVGLPAYEDDAPYPHVMETGTPHARYALVCRGRNGWVVDDVAVPYDWEAAIRAAEENGRPDWAAWLATGRADGPS